VFEVQQFLVAIAIGSSLMMAGAYAFNKTNPALTTRVLVGAVLVIAGFSLSYPLLDGTDVLASHQIRLGLAVALTGLGINQAAAPIRVAFGRPA